MAPIADELGKFVYKGAFRHFLPTVLHTCILLAVNKCSGLKVSATYCTQWDTSLLRIYHRMQILNKFDLKHIYPPQYLYICVFPQLLLHFHMMLQQLRCSIFPMKIC